MSGSERLGGVAMEVEMPRFTCTRRNTLAMLQTSFTPSVLWN